MYNQIQQAHQVLNSIEQIAFQMRQSESSNRQLLSQLEQKESMAEQKLAQIQQLCRECSQVLQGVAGTQAGFQPQYQAGYRATTGFTGYAGQPGVTTGINLSTPSLPTSTPFASVATMSPETYSAATARLGGFGTSPVNIGQQAGIAGQRPMLT
ncbi:MAG: hypothetical protein QHH10_13410 [Peptococcaceae bacterium]|nr:hypothetical protein [Peptococcaceae bacterium]MDH7526292.1 hypothetical protein [Peptococcaceae bacterium]